MNGRFIRLTARYFCRQGVSAPLAIGDQCACSMDYEQRRRAKRHMTKMAQQIAGASFFAMATIGIARWNFEWAEGGAGSWIISVAIGTTLVLAALTGIREPLRRIRQFTTVREAWIALWRAWRHPVRKPSIGRWRSARLVALTLLSFATFALTLLTYEPNSRLVANPIASPAVVMLWTYLGTVLLGVVFAYPAFKARNDTLPALQALFFGAMIAIGPMMLATSNAERVIGHIAFADGASQSEQVVMKVSGRCASQASRRSYRRSETIAYCATGQTSAGPISQCRTRLNRRVAAMADRDPPICLRLTLEWAGNGVARFQANHRFFSENDLIPCPIAKRAVASHST